MPVHLEGENFAHWPITIGDNCLRNHAAMTNSVLYLPIRELFELFGTSVVWDSENGRILFIDSDGEIFYLSEKDNTIRRISDGEIAADECYTIDVTDNRYIEIKSASKFLNLSYTFDWKTVTIFINENNG